jgi:predicted HicB family RNase H-like nuclease
MPRNNKVRDSLPESFKTVDEFIEFWDTHSTADYPEAFREIKGPVKVQRRRYYRVALAAHVGEQLAERARAQGLTLDALINQMLEEQLRHPA